MKISNFKFQIWGILLFALFIIFSILVSLNALSNIDYQTTVRTQSLLPNLVTTPFSILSLLGSAEIATAILLLLLLFFKHLKKLYVLFLYIFIGLIEFLGKTIIGQIGPPIEFLKTNIHLGFPSGNIPGEFFSYPSGHAARTAFISTVLLFILWKSSKLNKSLKLIFAFCILIFDFLMFLSRIYLGEHWSTDVVGGALLGFSLAILVSYFIKSLNPKKN